MTQLTRRTPSRSLRTLQREVDNIFDQFFDRVDEEGSAVWAPRTDLSESDEAFRIRLDVPGMTKEDITINLQNSTLTVSGERSTEHTRHDGEYVRMERAFGNFHRTFTLPDSVDPEGVEAAYDHGVLTINVPKTEGSSRRQIEIE